MARAHRTISRTSLLSPRKTVEVSNSGEEEHLAALIEASSTINRQAVLSTCGATREGETVKFVMADGC